MPGRQMDDLTGRRFSRLVVKRLSHKEKREYSYGWMTIIHWHCSCDCGGAIVVPGARLRNGHTPSCGCMKREKLSTHMTRHGGHNSPEYRVWSHIKGRCENSSDASYNNYGGRGIRVCSEWRDDFEAFIRDVGKRPSPKHQIDRINNEGDYEPGNVRWTTSVVNNRNRRTTRYVNYLGVERTLQEWSDVLHVPYGRIAARYVKGWSPEEILFGRIKF